MMIVKLIAFCALILSSSCEKDNGFFTVVGSKLLRKNSIYRVVVTPHNIKEPETLQLKIKSTSSNLLPSNYYEKVQNVTIAGVTAKTVEFDLKDQPAGDYSIQVKSSEVMNFTKEMRLNMNTKDGSVLVQTDKSIYKPADKVNFRVVVLSDEMRPRENVKVDVFITDGSDNRIKQFDNVELRKGVYQGELQLSDLPVLGVWKINVNCDHKKAFTKQFEVAEYTLPKFQVKIDANNDANFKEGKVRAVVSAKYTFGRIAKGNATITAKVPQFRRWHWRYHGEGENNDDVKVVKTVEVNGKHPVEFDIDSELKITDKSYERKVELFATFTEELTGRDMNASTTVTIHTTPHKVELKQSAEKFKPGLPFRISCFVMSHDKNAPVVDDKHPLEISISYYYDVLKNCTHQRDHSYYHIRYDDAGEPSETTTEISSDDEPKTTTSRPLRICREEKSYRENTTATIKNGIHEIDINLPNNITRIDVNVKYLDTENALYYITKDETENGQYIQVVKPKGKWWLRKNVKIDVLFTDDNITDLTYHIIAKGNVVESDTIELPQASVNAKKHQIEFKPKMSMMPQAKFIVFYLTGDGELISDATDIEFEEDLENHVDIALSKPELLPGDEITISVSSNPNSYVGLLGVDQSVLLLKSGNDIDKSSIFSEINAYNDVNEYNYGYSENYDWRTRADFERSNAFIITNAKKEFEKPYIPFDYNYGVYALAAHSDSLDAAYESDAAPMPESVSSFASKPVAQAAGAGPVMRKGAAPPSQPIQIRKEFPETWLFESFDLDSETSKINLTKKVPDTITSWVISAFAVDPLTGLGIVRNPSMFRVFQPFFVTTNLPYSIKRGEVVSLPILVFNYLDSDQEVEVTLFNADKEFEFTEVNQNENDVKSRTRRSLDEQRTKTVNIKSQEGMTLPFMIRPLKVGHIKVKVIAKSAIAGDGLEKLLIVEPEGVTKFNNKAIFIDLRENHEFSTDVSIDVPTDAVADSTRIETSAVGDLLGSSIENLDKLIKLPYGCGEQNMLNFVPNIVVLDYLTSVDRLTPEIATKAKNFMETGYQRELGYKHDDGSYSAFGKSDKNGSTWLTAFVVKSFIKASKFIQIDEHVITEALDFLAGVQNETDGSFPEVGQVFHSDMQGGSSKGVALTAYTLTTFLEKENATKYQKNIDRALNYVKNNLESVKDNYSLAIIAYALQIAKDPSADLFLNKLDIRAEKKDGKAFWKKDMPKSEGPKDFWRSEPKSINVEMTAYGLQAYVEAGNDTDAIPIMRWLVAQRNENGGFESTQDTVVGLQALAKIAAKIYSPTNEIEIEVRPDVGNPSKLSVNRANSLILQKNELNSASRNFHVSAKGNGFGILNVAYRYNVDVNGESPRFQLGTKLHENSNKNFLHLIACTSFAIDETIKRSNMAVMEIQLPSGFTFDSDTVDELKSTRNVKKIETKESDTIVVIYFDSIDENDICPEIKAYRAHSVAKQKPVPVKVYDYYDTSRKATTFYNPPEISLCDICDGAEECKSDCEVPEANVVM